MSDTANAPAEQEAPETTTEPVRDPQAVLAQNSELLAEVKRLKKLTKDADGFDFEKARAAIAAQEQAEAERLAAEGEWAQLKTQLEQRHERDLKQAQKDYDRLVKSLTQEGIKAEAVRNGVLPDRLKAAMAEGDLENILELEIDENGHRLKKKGGIGDAVELAEVFTELKKSAPYLFASQTQTGGGASGSGNNGGVKADANLSPTARLESIFSGGK